MADSKNNPEQQDNKSKMKPMWFIMLVGVLLVVTVGLVVYFIGHNYSSNNLADAKQLDSSDKHFSSRESLGPLVKIENFVVNIMDNERTRYLKAALTLEAIDKKTKEEIDQRKPQIRDAILFHVSNKKFREISDLQGKKQLRAELIHRINSLLSKGKIRRIFFTEFVVQ